MLKLSLNNIDWLKSEVSYSKPTNIVEQLVVISVKELQVSWSTVEDDAARARVPAHACREQRKACLRSHPPRQLLYHTAHSVLCIRQLNA